MAQSKDLSYHPTLGGINSVYNLRNEADIFFFFLQKNETKTVYAQSSSLTDRVNIMNPNYFITLK